MNIEPIIQAQKDYNKSKKLLKELENYDIRKITFNQLHKAQEEYDQNKNIFYDRIAQNIREYPNDWYLNNKFFEIVTDIGNRETINNLIYKNNKSIIHNALLASDIFNHTTMNYPYLPHGWGRGFLILHSTLPLSPVLQDGLFVTVVYKQGLLAAIIVSIIVVVVPTVIYGMFFSNTRNLDPEEVKKLAIRNYDKDGNEILK